MKTKGRVGEIASVLQVAQDEGFDDTPCLYNTFFRDESKSSPFRKTERGC
jgi:hypothetical protein